MTNLIDGCVTKVRKITEEYGKFFVHVWYEDDFTDGEHTTELMFNTMEEAKKVKKGRHFLT